MEHVSGFGDSVQLRQIIGWCLTMPAALYLAETFKPELIPVLTRLRDYTFSRHVPWAGPLNGHERAAAVQAFAAHLRHFAALTYGPTLTTANLGGALSIKSFRNQDAHEVTCENDHHLNSADTYHLSLGLSNGLAEEERRSLRAQTWAGGIQKEIAMRTSHQDEGAGVDQGEQLQAGNPLECRQAIQEVQEDLSALAVWDGTYQDVPMQEDTASQVMGTESHPRMPFKLLPHRWRSEKPGSRYEHTSDSGESSYTWIRHSLSATTDFMHLMFEGVNHTLLKLWIDPTQAQRR
jgi:hypothetical protein